LNQAQADFLHLVQIIRGAVNDLGAEGNPERVFLPFLITLIPQSHIPTDSSLIQIFALGLKLEPATMGPYL
jgi:hypothetical protein